MTDHKLLEDAARKATPGRWISKKSVHGNKYRFVQFGKEENYTTLELEAADADYIALANPTYILSVLEELSTLKARQRTPGTVEVCRLCGGDLRDMGGHCRSVVCPVEWPITRPGVSAWPT